MKDSKNLVIGMLCAVVCVMAVAYAAFSTTLKIEGTATISSNWDVAITNINCTATEAEGGVDAVVAAQTFDRTTATFGITFNQPGDKGQCVVTITNDGSLNAVVDTITVVDNDDDTATINDGPIQYAVSGITQGTTLAANGGTNSYTIDVEFVDVYDGAAIPDDEKSKTLTVVIDYVQDMTAA